MASFWINSSRSLIWKGILHSDEVEGEGPRARERFVGRQIKTDPTDKNIDFDVKGLSGIG